jgi:hypothetical protein
MPHVASLQAFVVWFPFFFVRAVLVEHAIVVRRGARFACQGCHRRYSQRKLEKLFKDCLLSAFYMHAKLLPPKRPLRYMCRLTENDETCSGTTTCCNDVGGMKRLATSQTSDPGHGKTQQLVLTH